MTRIDSPDLTDPERVQPRGLPQRTLRWTISSAVVSTAPDHWIEDD